MDTNNLNLVDDEYDDGVVCFGPVTESQLNRYKRLPRRTVLPSDFELSQSYFEQDENKINDQSTVLDVSNENTTPCVDNSINITRSTNNFDEEKEEVGTIELKQSFSEDSNSKFSSPCFSKCIPNAKLMDTEVINRYIRMGSTSSNDSSLSEDQNKSTFKDETVSFADAQEMESVQENYVFDETSTCEHLSVSSVIEQSASMNQQNVLDDSNNVCTLVHCSQKDDTDLSICSDSELEDVTEDSIVADEYSVTPGKQRLFDLRVTKQSLRGKVLVASAPFMDRIEETTTPVVPKVLNPPLVLNDISYRHSEIKGSINVLSAMEIRHGTPIEHFNQSANENVFETPKLIDETAEELLISNSLKNNKVSMNKSADIMFEETINSNKLSTDSYGMNFNKSLTKTDQIRNTLNDMVHVSNNDQSMNIMTNITVPTDVINHYDKEYLIAAEHDTISSNPSVEDETMNTNKLSTNNRSMDLNQSLNETEHKINDEKSMCIISNKTIPTSDISYHNDEEFSVVTEVDIKSSNTSCVDNKLNETACSNWLSINNQRSDLGNSLNETSIKNTLNDTEHKFDTEKSMNIMSNMTLPTSDINDHNDEEFSAAMEVDIKSTNTSCVDKELDETLWINRPSINNQSTDLNESNIKNTLNDTEHKFDSEKSINIRSNMAIATSNVNKHNDEEFSVAMEVDINSTYTSCVDKELDETVWINIPSINNQSTDLNKSLNETNIENTLNDTEDKFDGGKSINIMSNMAIATSDVNDRNNEEFSVAMEVDINSTNTSCVDKELDETVWINIPSINNQSTDLNKSLNETNIENTLNDTEHKFDGEKSINIMSNMAIATSDVYKHNDEEFSVVTEVDIISISTNAVDKIFDETVNTNKFSTNNKSTDLNESLNETNIENTLNDTEHKFDGEKSINIMSNMAIATSDVYKHNDEEFSVVTEVDIISISTNAVDKIFDETVNTNKFSTNNKSTDLNESLNESNIKNTLNDSELKFDGEKSMDIMFNMAIPTSDVNDHNDEKFLVVTEVDINSTNTSCVDKELEESVWINIPSINNQSTDLNESIIKNTLNDTEHKFDGEKPMNIMSNIAIPTLVVNDHNDKENSIATKVDIKSINTSIVVKIFDESMLINADKLLTESRAMNCNNSLNETESTSNITEHKFKNNIQNTPVSTINFDDKLVLSKLDKSLLKNTINSDNSLVGINEVNITCNTSLEDPSCKMGQYLDFERAVNEMCNDISSASCPGGNSNKPIEKYDDETLENLIEQTLSSGTFNQTKVNENLSNYDGSNLSVIIENKSLETSCNNIEQNEDFVNPNNDIPINLESESSVKEVNDIGSLNKSTVVNIVTTPSKSEVGLAYGTDVNIQVKANESILINSTDVVLVENINKTKHNGSSTFSDELSKMELNTFSNINKNLNDITAKQIVIPENVNEIHSTQTTSDENNLYPIANQINITDIPYSTAFKLIPETETTQKTLIDREELLNNDNQQQDLLDTTKCIDYSLEEFTNLEQMFNLGDNKKEEQVEYKTPKIQKLLDFSIIQQTPSFDNPAKKQKVLDFSIVDQTPILQSTQQIYPNKNVIKNFSSVDQMWNSEVMTKDNINFKDFLNSSNDSTSNNLSTISPPDLELLPDESIKTNTSNFSNSSFDQTITDSNLNLEPLMSINKKAFADKPSDSLNQTIEHNQEPCYNSNERAIVDFSIIDQGMLVNVELKNNTDITSFESDRNVSNLIEMSHVTKSDEQSIILSENAIIPISSQNISEKSIHNSSDEMNSTALHLEESNTELLTDIQMNDESLLIESPEKSSTIDSFHSIELDHVQEDNKRKMETTQEYDNNEKKMKVDTEMLKTPMSMLYKIKNMFRSSERQPSCLNNTKENNFKSDKCYQKLNFNKFEENNENVTKLITLKKPEVIVKSKIPCKVTDRSITKNDEFNSSSLSSLNDSIKQKKTIPKFSGVPVLSDVSNSSNRKCAESRIPSKFQK